MVEDFVTIAKPLLDQLQDDPARSPSRINTITFPLENVDIEGELVPLDRELDSPSLTGGSEPIDADIEAGRKAYRQGGIDVWAFYKSFRFLDRSPFKGRWGIFLLDTGIYSLAAEFMEQGLLQGEAKDLAVSTLLAHERYHFWIDAWALGQEFIPDITPRVKRYEYYLDEKRTNILTEYDIEERLANHYVLRQLKTRRLHNGSSAAGALRTIFLNCPEPYSLFAFSSRTRAITEGELAGAVFNGMNPVITSAAFALKGASNGLKIASSSIRPSPAGHPFVNRQACPVYEVRISGYATLVQPFQGPTLREFRKFVEDYLSGQKGDKSDHDYYRIDNGEKIKFPNPHDKEVRGYELKGTLLKAGMTNKEFLQERIATDYWQKKCPRERSKPRLGKAIDLGPGASGPRPIKTSTAWE